MGNNCGKSEKPAGLFQSMTAAVWKPRHQPETIPTTPNQDQQESKNNNADDTKCNNNNPSPINSNDDVSDAEALPGHHTKPTHSVKHVTVKEENQNNDDNSGSANKPLEEAKSNKLSKFKRVASVGLQVASVLQRKTENLKEKYHIGKKLGEGQFGTTYLCLEKETNRELACKTISKRKLTTVEDVEDVRREIQIMHHLAEHPNIISIVGAYEDAVAVYVVMELCSGGELFDSIIERGHYSERKAAELAKVIVGVVESCHSMGVMHRDLKPENFLFVDDEEDSPIMTIDFGLSVFFKPGETFSDVVGSPYYVAPEVLKKHYGQECDVWSAGVIIYILLSGVPPFWDETE